MSGRESSICHLSKCGIQRPMGGAYLGNRIVCVPVELCLHVVSRTLALRLSQVPFGEELQHLM
jgi:hypothetical protein